MDLFIRIALGLVFILSAVSKLWSIDGFELFVFKALSLDWMLTTVLVRLFIAFELTIGYFYVLGIAIKKTGIAALVAISLLSVWLLIQWFNGNQENCHCFGELFQMNPIASLLKNACLIGFIVFQLKTKEDNRLKVPVRFLKIFSSLIISFSLVTPIILSPPDFLVSGRYGLNGVTKNLHLEELDKIPWRGTTKTVKLNQGKKIIIFMSMTCKSCQKAAKKISIINARHADTLAVSYIFFGDPRNLPLFWKASESFRFPYKIISSARFFSITKKMPTVFFVHQGKVINILGYRNLTDEAVETFFGLD